MPLEPRHPTPNRGRSHLLNRELELQSCTTYRRQTDLLMAETAEIRSDPGTDPAAMGAGALRATCLNSPGSSMLDAPGNRSVPRSPLTMPLNADPSAGSPEHFQKIPTMSDGTENLAEAISEPVFDN